MASARKHQRSAVVKSVVAEVTCAMSSTLTLGALPKLSPFAFTGSSAAAVAASASFPSTFMHAGSTSPAVGACASHAPLFPDKAFVFPSSGGGIGAFGAFAASAGAGNIFANTIIIGGTAVAAPALPSGLFGAAPAFPSVSGAPFGGTPVATSPAIDVQIWDLAGQDVYTLSHSVHFFHRSLYLLLWKPGETLDATMRRVCLWLEALCMHACQGAGAEHSDACAAGSQQASHSIAWR